MTRSRYFLAPLLLLTLMAPMTAMIQQKEQLISANEKRVLAPKPKLTLNITELKTFPKRFEAWFKDHFGFREDLIQLYNGIYVTIFRTSPKWNVIVGEDGWLFLANEFVIQDYTGHHLYNTTRLQHWKKNLFERKAWLTKRDINYLWVIPPNKIQIYPEKLPDKLRVRKGLTHLEQFTTYLNSPPIFSDRVDLLPSLLRAKSLDQLYLKADTHWNTDGSYIAYKEIIRHLANSFPEFTPIPKDHLKREYHKIRGDLSLILNLGKMFEEDSSTLRHPALPPPIVYQKLIVPPHPLSDHQRFRHGKFTVHESPEKTRTAVFISDSFGSALQEFLAPHFKKIVFIKDARFEDITHFLDTFRPDVVIDLNVARAMYITLGDSDEITREVMADTFTDLRTKLSLDITAQNFRSYLKQVSQLAVSEDTTGEMIATGEDPQLHFTLPQRMSRGILSLNCNLESEKNDVFKLYFTQENSHEYSESNCLKFAIHPGTNRIYMRLTKPVFMGALRLDPGEKKSNRFRLLRFAAFEEEVAQRSGPQS